MLVTFIRNWIAGPGVVYKVGDTPDLPIELVRRLAHERMISMSPAELEAQLTPVVSGAGNKYPAAQEQSNVILTSWAAATYLSGGAGNAAQADFGVSTTGNAAGLAAGRVTSVGFAPKYPADGVFRGIRIKVRGPGRASGLPIPLTVIIARDSSFAKYDSAKFFMPAESMNSVIDVPCYAFNSPVGGYSVEGDGIGCIRIIDEVATVGPEAYPISLSTEAQVVGDVSFIPAQPSLCILRFDDGLSDLLYPGATFAANGKTRAWSVYELLAEYGFTGAAFILTSKVGRGTIGTGGKSYLSWGDLRRLRDLGWSICGQSHYDPLSQDSKGVKLLGPEGYTRPAITALASNTFTTAAAHNILATPFWMPVVFYGAAPPTGITADGSTVYYARYVTATTFTIHPTDADAVAGTNTIALSGGTIGQYGYRHAWATNDHLGIQADYTNMVAAMRAAGFDAGAAYYAPNQGQLDALCRKAMDTVGFRIISGTAGISPTYYPLPAYFGGSPSFSESSGAVSYYPGLGNIPGTLTPDAGAVTESVARQYIQRAARMGGLFTITHHFLTASNGPVLAAALDEIKRQGVKVVAPAEAAAFLAQGI